MQSNPVPATVDPAELDRAYKQIVVRCLGVRPGEDVLVVMDPERRGMGNGMIEAIREVGGEAIAVMLWPNATRGSEPPAAIAAALAKADAFLAPCLPSLSHTTARKEASAAGVRGATLPGATLGMIARLMTADLELVERRSAAIASLLSQSDRAHVACPLGTDIVLDLSGRAGISDDGNLREAGAFGNLPCGEGFISPSNGEGVIAASVLPTSGIVAEPVMLTVDGDRLVDAHGGPAGAADAFLGALDAHGTKGRALAEFGVGTNENAEITGNILEDEKVLGTVHIAFGASAGIGGDVTVPVHLDVVVLSPTVRIGETPVLENGRFVLDA